MGEFKKNISKGNTRQRRLFGFHAGIRHLGEEGYPEIKNNEQRIKNEKIP